MNDEMRETTTKSLKEEYKVVHLKLVTSSRTSRGCVPRKSPQRYLSLSYPFNEYFALNTLSKGRRKILWMVEDCISVTLMEPHENQWH